MTNEDVIRSIDKTLDVLLKVEAMMQAEAYMNATKHLSDTVRPTPLAAAVTTAVADLQGTRAALRAS